MADDKLHASFSGLLNVHGFISKIKKHPATKENFRSPVNMWFFVRFQKTKSNLSGCLNRYHIP
jgi:hypothetical protein